jgi:hypothetical protein
MTASEEAGPAERTAERDAAPGSGLSPQATVAGDGQETEPLTGSIAAPDDPQQLEREIERTRERLGQTVQEMAARADVKSRARAKAAAATGRVKSTTVQAGKNAAARAGNVRSQVAGQAGAARQKAMSAGSAGKDQLRTRAAAVGAPVWQATPEQVRQAVTKGADRARDQWVPLAAAAAVLIVGYLAFRQWGRRQSNSLPTDDRGRPSRYPPIPAAPSRVSPRPRR